MRAIAGTKVVQVYVSAPLHSMIGYWHHNAVGPSLSVYDAVHCGAQGGVGVEGRTIVLV